MNDDELGLVQTPPPLADWVAAEALIEAPNSGDRILYPGAGHGNLAAAVHRRCSVRGLPAPDATFIDRNPDHLDIVANRFIGDTAPMNNGIPRMTSASARYHTPARRQAVNESINTNVELRATDFLRDPPEAPFEYILTNPPYTAYSIIDADDRDTYTDRFDAATGQYPLYAPFIEQCLNLVADDGLVIFLAPDSYLTRGHSEQLRWLLRKANTATPILVPDPAFDEMVQAVITTVSRSDNSTLGIAVPPTDRRFSLTTVSAYEAETLLDRVGLPDIEIDSALSEYFDTARWYRRRRLPSVNDNDHKSIPGTASSSDFAGQQVTLQRF
jgi:hypothetical protein